VDPWPGLDGEVTVVVGAIVVDVVVVDVDGGAEVVVMVFGGATEDAAVVGVTAGAETLGAGWLTGVTTGLRSAGTATAPTLARSDRPPGAAAAASAASPLPAGGPLGPAAAGGAARSRPETPNVGRWSGPTPGSRVNPTATRPR
jgi:hypothetical protein